MSLVCIALFLLVSSVVAEAADWRGMEADRKDRLESVEIRKRMMGHFLGMLPTQTKFQKPEKSSTRNGADWVRWLSVANRAILWPFLSIFLQWHKEAIEMYCLRYQ